MFDSQKPYNDLPPLPPKAEIETRTVLKACIGARAALAELRLAGQLLPDQSVLISAIPVLEAKDSSAIENIVTTNDALFREASLADGGNDAAAKEALRYRAALYHGFAELKERPLTARSAIDICRVITGIDLDIRANPGTTLKNTGTGEVIYIPPVGQAHLRKLLSNWESFVNSPSDLDPVVKLAIQHYQFEAIHPFPDGNGRTGRILNILFLNQEGLLDLPTLYLSRFILRTRADYYRLLLRVTAAGEWEPWILYMLKAVEETSRWTNGKVRAIRGLMDETSRHLQREAPKIYSRELIETIFAQPYCRIGNLTERNIAKRETASMYLKTLAEIGVLIEEKSGRDKVFIHRRYIDLLGSDEHTILEYSGRSKPQVRKSKNAPAKRGKAKP